MTKTDVKLGVTQQKGEIQKKKAEKVKINSHGEVRRVNLTRGDS